MSAWGNAFPTLTAPLPNPQLRFVSAGMGVQSTTLLLAAARSDVGPMPDCAIFADTMWEPQRVYDHVERLRSRLPFPIHVVSEGDLRAAAIDSDRKEDRFAVPFYVRKPDGSIGMGKRQCTRHFKIKPIKRKVREILGVGPRGYIRPDSVEQWIGISIDEAERMAATGVAFMRNRYPLIEAMMSRRDCERWLADRQEKASKSRCRGCPFQTQADWREQRDTDPEGFAQTIVEDRAIRHRGATAGSQQFMHFSGVPLDQVDFDSPLAGGFDFGSHCDGHCGV